MAYQLQLPIAWKIHNVFHASLLSPYRKTTAHRPNFTWPPPDLIEGEEEYEVESILNHWHHGRSRTLQYLIKWKNYPHSDNTWKPADQVHAPELMKAYHCKQPKTMDKKALRNERERVNHSFLLPHSGSPTWVKNTLSTLQKGRHLLPRPSPTHWDILPVAPFSDKGVNIHSGPWSSHLHPRRGHSPPFLPVTTPRLPTQTWENLSPKKMMNHSLSLALAPPVAPQAPKNTPPSSLPPTLSCPTPSQVTNQRTPTLPLPPPSLLPLRQQPNFKTLWAPWCTRRVACNRSRRVGGNS